MADHLYKRGRTWWCWYYDHRGACHRVSTRCTDRAAAKARLRQFEQRASGLPIHEPAAPYPLKEAIKDFIALGLHTVAPATAIMYRQKAGHLVRIMGELETGSLSYDDVVGYIQQRKGPDERAHPHTIQKELVTLRRVLKLAARRSKPVADHRIVIPEHSAEYEPRERWLTEDEYMRLLHEFRRNERKKDWLRVGVYSGCRRGELQRLTHAHVDGPRLRVPGSKTTLAKRIVPIEEPLRRCLDAMPRRTGPLLQPWGQIGRDIKRACKRIEIAPVTLNDLRRTFASWMLQKGVDTLVVARLLGHGSTRMVERVYGQLADANLINAIRRLPDPECEAGVRRVTTAVAVNDSSAAVAKAIS